jgi:putative glutamine amidotransferase
VVAASSTDRARPYLAALRTVGIEHTVVVARDALPDGGVTALDLAALVLAGGADVEPHRYGEKPRPDAGLELVPERDELEWQLLRVAAERKLPVWGICRGLQVLNVYLGGTLWQDLQQDRPGDTAHDPGGPAERLAHPVAVVSSESALGQRLAAPGEVVNSRHHQGLRELAPALKAVAVSPDGLIEAVGLADDRSPWWVRAVQWHPENLVDIPTQRLLWEDFADAVDSAAMRT